MTRFAPCSFAFLLASCIVLAQNPAPTASPTAAQPSVTTTESPEIREFQKIEDSWSDAVTTRNQQVATLITGEDKTIHLDQRVITVRMLGDIAVANGTYTLHHKVNSSEANEKGVFTHVFERVHGGWLCINSQRTTLREESNAKQKRQSNAELPFHIPLFQKSDKGPQ